MKRLDYTNGMAEQNHLPKQAYTTFFQIVYDQEINSFIQTTALFGMCYTQPNLCTKYTLDPVNLKIKGQSKRRQALI